MALKHVEGKHEDSSDLFFWDDVLKDEGPESIFDFSSEIKESEKKGPGRGWWGSPKGTHGKGEEFTKVGEVLEWREREYAGWMGSLTDVEKTALANYAGFGARSVNKYLRAGGHATPISQEYRDIIPGVDSALKKGSAPKVLVAYKSFYADKVAKWLFENKFVPGMTFEDKGFVSTSLVRDAARSVRGQKYMARIQIPEGALGAFLGPGIVGKDQVMDEVEYLLPRNSQFKVRGVTTSPEGNKMVDMDWVGVGS